VQPENIGGLTVQINPRQLSPQRDKCKPFICTGGNSVVIADKSDDFLAGNLSGLNTTRAISLNAAIKCG
jgi:hypothetical protein